MIHLRPYQQLAMDEVRAEFRRYQRVLLTSPTGSGKTVIFSAVTHGAVQKGRQTLILAHRVELIEQIAAALDAVGVEYGYIAAGYPRAYHAPVQIASVQTVVRRLDKIKPPDFIVCDEAHHILAETYRKVLAAFPQAKVLGVTATPRRASGEGLGEIFGSMVEGPTVAQLIESRYLSPFKIYGPPTVATDGLHIRAGEFVQSEVAAVVDKPTVMGDAIEHYRKLADGAPAVVFCYSVEHSRQTAEAFRAAGYKFEHIDGGFEREQRKSIVRDFRQGRIQGLCSCDLVSEGFDVPGIHCGILLRPTASEGLYLQQVGRCLRTSASKPQAIIVDHVGNARRHGLPDEERNWSLEGEAKRARKEASRISVRICPQCFAANRSIRQTCIECGTPFPVEPREVAHVEGELVEIQRRQARREQGQAKSLEELQAIGKQRGYHPYWAIRVWNARKGATRDTPVAPRMVADAGESERDLFGT